MVKNVAVNLRLYNLLEKEDQLCTYRLRTDAHYEYLKTTRLTSCEAISITLIVTYI